MFWMGQDQNEGVELEDKVVESQPSGVKRTIEIPRIYVSCSPDTGRVQKVLT